MPDQYGKGFLMTISMICCVYASWVKDFFTYFSPGGSWEARQGNSFTNLRLLLVAMAAGLQKLGWWPRASAASEHTENPLPHFFFTFFFCSLDELLDVTR